MKKIIIIITLLLSVKNYSQGIIKLTILQDAKLGLIGDNKGNNAFTTDLLVKFKLTGKQFEYGYLTISPYLEYAEINGIYKRYAVDVGFTFNKLIIKNLEITPSINYGIQDRYKKSWLVFGSDIEANYKLTDNIGLTALAQFVERKDLLWMYGDKKIRFSGFIGITMNIFNTKK